MPAATWQPDDNLCRLDVFHNNQSDRNTLRWATCIKSGSIGPSDNNLTGHTDADLGQLDAHLTWNLELKFNSQRFDTFECTGQLANLRADFVAGRQQFDRRDPG